MRSMTRTTVIALGITALIGCAAPVRAADTQWPSEQEQQLATLDAQLIDVQQRLFTAKQTNDTAGTESLTAEFNSVQTQRFALLRAMGLVSEHDIANNNN